VANCTLSGNSPTIDGGGVLGMLSSGSTVANWILWSNTGGQCLMLVDTGMAAFTGEP